MKATTVQIQFDSMNSVLEFVNIMERESAKADIVGGRFQLSATSLLGLLTVGFNKAYDLVIYDNESKSDRILDKIKNYIVA